MSNGEANRKVLDILVKSPDQLWTIYLQTCVWYEREIDVYVIQATVIWGFLFFTALALTLHLCWVETMPGLPSLTWQHPTQLT